MQAKKRLGEMLMEAGVIDAAQLQAALGHQRKWGGKLGQALVDLKLATEADIVSALSRKFGFDVAKVSSLAPSAPLEVALRLIPRELALRQTLLPVAADTASITVVMADPSNIAVVDEIAFRTGRRVKVALAGDREIAAAVRRLYFAEEDSRGRAIALDVPPPLPARPATTAPLPTAEGEPDPLGEPILATDLAPEDEGPPAPREAQAPAELDVQPARLLAALIKVLVRRGLVSQAEIVEELERARR